MTSKSTVYMIAGLHALNFPPHPFNYARPLMAQHHGRVGYVGYEINFSRHFYRYMPPWPLEAIEADIRAIAASLDWKTGKIDALIAEIGKAIKRLKEFRTGLISAAVRGKLDVQEEVAV